jgi:hypothetical protein
MGYLIDILIGAASRIVMGELSAHVEPFAHWLVGKAADRLPPDYRERFLEEWLAHLDEVPGSVRKLWHAAGCYVAAGKVGTVFAQQLERGQTEWRGWLDEHEQEIIRPLAEVLLQSLLDNRQPWVTEDEVRSMVRRAFPRHKKADDVIELLTNEIKDGMAWEITHGINRDAFPATPRMPSRPRDGLPSPKSPCGPTCACARRVRTGKSATREILERVALQTAERIVAGRECSCGGAGDAGASLTCCRLVVDGKGAVGSTDDTP